MKTMIALAALLSFTVTAPGQQTLADYQWRDLTAKGLIRGPVSTLELDGRAVLKIENTNDAPLRINLLNIENPAITAQVYEVLGEIRYDAAKGDGFLEMLNHFPPVKPGSPTGTYFSRTLGDYGPMGKISGQSGWRDFTLPFNRTGTTQPPVKLEINLFLPGRGTVYLGPLKLAQLPNAKSAAAAMFPNSWWSPSATGQIFGWGGAILGCLGGLCGYLGAKGKARGLVTALFTIMITLGLASGVVGMLGAFLNQPFFIWVPLLGAGLLLLLVCPVNMRNYRRRYEEQELRRMASMDARGA
jgi:hypothetical protein